MIGIFSIHLMIVVLNHQLSRQWQRHALTYTLLHCLRSSSCIYNRPTKKCVSRVLKFEIIKNKIKIGPSSHTISIIYINKSAYLLRQAIEWPATLSDAPPLLVYINTMKSARNEPKVINNRFELMRSECATGLCNQSGASSRV